MKILAIDTSSEACSVAFLNDDEAKIRHEIVPMRHAKYILSYIDEVLGAELSSLDALAWGCGPGSFTGLRISASVMQALGFTHHLPVIKVSSLAALAQTVYQEKGWKRQLVAVDARMQEVYWGVYRINDLGYAELVGGEGLAAPQSLPRDPFGTEAWYGVGSAWSVYQAELQGFKTVPREIDATSLPKALAVAQLGRLKYEKGESMQSFDALPTYLRDNVCKNS